MPKNRIFYNVLALGVSPSPSTGFMFQTGFGTALTGANSGQNLIQTLSRLQSVSDSFTQTRQNVNQLGQLGIVAKIITEPPTVPLEFSWVVADVSNEKILGINVSGLGAMTNILNNTQADKNYFIQVAPEGVDAVGWTGQSQVKYVTNGFLTSYSTEGAVGGLPTTTVGVQGFNWAASTGSFNQPLFAIDYLNNVLTTGKLFTLPVAGSGLANAVPAIRPSEIQVLISGGSALGIGLVASDVKLQRYNISFNLNPQKLTKLGSFFPYTVQPQFPVDVNASVTAYWGDLTTGSLSTLQCNDQEYSVTVQLLQPYCLGQAPGALAAQYQVLGAKLASQSFSDAINDVASTVTLNFVTTIGGPTDTSHNLLITGISF